MGRGSNASNMHTSKLDKSFTVLQQTVFKLTILSKK